MKKKIFNYGPIADSQAIESEFDKPEVKGDFGNIQRVSVKRFLSTTATLEPPIPLL